ncbi:MAG: glutaconyl-CoA decarboxylase subunit beta, partial [Firmicutes bacterium]|nr:glutaconyl-CoA decarboxylase subunit beta [Bacillota bacterium]
TMNAETFLSPKVLFIFCLGLVAFATATATGIIFAKIMNLFLKEKINPLIGAAGVSAVPMSARVMHRLAQSEDKRNWILMHAMGPNVAGVIGTAVAAGMFISMLGGK